MQFRVNLKNLLAIAVFIAFGYLALLLWGFNERFPDVEVELRDIVSYAVLAVEVGGHAVAQVNTERDFDIIKKGGTAEGGNELLTKADLVSNFLILDVLQRFPGLNIITEEKGSTLSEADVQKYIIDKYDLWLNVRTAIEKLPSRKLKLSKLTVWVDPLDATQEFTEGLLDYVSVMICIAFDGEPVFGAIYRPFSNETIFGLKDFGIMNSMGEKWDPSVLQRIPKIILISRSHAGAVSEAVTKAFGSRLVVEAAGGSGYKILRLLNGTAELYIHKTAIKKWDVCAGDALIRSVGGALLDLQGSPLDYRRSTQILNRHGLIAAVKNPYSFYKKWAEAEKNHLF